MQLSLVLPEISSKIFYISSQHHQNLQKWNLNDYLVQMFNLTYFLNLGDCVSSLEGEGHYRYYPKKNEPIFTQNIHTT